MSDEQGPGYSINVSGGEVQIGALAQGPNARASAVVTNVTEARDVAADLRRALQEAGAPHEAAAELETELAAAEPDRGRIEALLERVGAAATAVAPAVALLAQLRVLVGL